jgi:hypothetical protein
MAIRITCINKEHGFHQDLHHAISHLGWVNEENGKTGKNTRLEIYNWLKNENGAAYVTDGAGNRAYVYPKENQNGTKFVQTYADDVWTDNLLYLPECP